jgi:hypothetical protein
LAKEGFRRPIDRVQQLPNKIQQHKVPPYSLDALCWAGRQLLSLTRVHWSRHRLCPHLLDSCRCPGEVSRTLDTGASHCTEDRQLTSLRSKLVQTRVRLESGGTRNGPWQRETRKHDAPLSFSAHTEATSYILVPLRLRRTPKEHFGRVMK